MTVLAGNRLSGIAKKRETTIRHLPMAMLLVGMEAITRAFIWRTSENGSRRR